MTTNDGRFLARPAGVVLAGLSVALGLAVAQPARISQPVDASKTTILMGNRTSKAQPEDDRGPVGIFENIAGMTLVLKPSAVQAADLERLLERQRTPSSPDYHRWLTPEQYADRFGANPDDLGKVTTWLEGQGFRLDYVSRARTWVLFSGTAGQAGKAFHTELHRYNVGGESHFANTVAPSIPAALDPVVALIRGLDDFRTASRGLVPIANFTSTGDAHFLVPGDLAKIYDITPLYQRGITGAGQKVVIPGQTEVRLSDIEHFRSEYGLPANDPSLVLVTGSSDPGVRADDLIESDLDLEYAGAIAPDARILFVYSSDVWTSVAFAVDQVLAPVISSSYGFCEAQVSSTPAATASYFRSLAQAANSMGITWVASSGDTGAADCDPNSEAVARLGLAVDLPASIPEVTGVGGTEFLEGSGNYWGTVNNSNGSSALSYIPEIAWNDTAAVGTLLGTGGGASIFFAKPAWQSGGGVPADNVRHVPDIALAAAVAHDPYQIYTNGAALYVGGTSAPAPVFSGMLALLNQYLAGGAQPSQSGLGNINPGLYRLAQQTSGIFHDVTADSNIVPCASGTPDCASGQFGYYAGVGYDQATGLGSLDVYNFVVAWNSSQPIATTTSLGATVLNINAGSATVLTATVGAAGGAAVGAASPDGSVVFTLDQNVLGTVALSGSGGVSSAILAVNGSQLAAGANVIAAAYTGSAIFGASSASITIGSASVTAAAVSVTPSSGSGTTQTFSLQYSDTAGAANLGQVWVYFNATLLNPAINGCLLYYNIGNHQINLLGNNGAAWQAAVLGTATTLQNNQCTINVQATTVEMNGTNLTLSLAMTFKLAFAGSKNVYLHGIDLSGVNSGWQQRGVWAVAFSAGTSSTVAVTPSSGSGTNQTFAFQYSDAAGAASLQQVWAYFNTTLANPAGNACMLYYSTASNQINLLGDNGTAWQAATVGAEVTLQNSQCSLNSAAITVTLNGNSLALNVAIAFKPAFAGEKNIYLHVVDVSGANNGWQQLGAWTVALTSGTPATVAVTMGSGSGISHTFTLQYSDAAGAGNLQQVWVYINATLANPAVNSCLLYYAASANRINLLNDTATAWLAATPGTQATLQNSQCSLNVANTAVALNGDVLTLNLPITFQPVFAGAKNIYLKAVDASGADSGWQQQGTWTVPLQGIDVRPPPL